MDTILTELYEAFKPEFMSSNERKVLQEGSEVIERVEKQLSYHDFENFWQALGSLNDVQARESFALGFQLGVRLMLACQSPLDDIRT
ncbi:MAG: hypothetical protein HDT14_00545 [Oscillibacter sp.]|nr:hypothetical protein [Oscillibacter sp.]